MLATVEIQGGFEDGTQVVSTCSSRLSMTAVCDGDAEKPGGLFIMETWHDHYVFARQIRGFTFCLNSKTCKQRSIKAGLTLSHRSGSMFVFDSARLTAKALAVAHFALLARGEVLGMCTCICRCWE